MDTDKILTELKNILNEQFEIDPGDVTPEARLYEDLDLDSIDAVDLVIRLQQLTGKKIKPEEFKEVRTVGDIENAVRHLISASA
ncbi:MAG: acyl carrier protein [Gammaproteobacteria bacterium]|jgi:acyl carrier protein